jgi:hypothetical protein
VRGEVFQRTALDDDCLRAQDRRIHREKGEQIQQRPVAGDSRHVDVDLGEVFAKVLCRKHVKGIQHFKTDLGMLSPGAVNAIGTDVRPDYLFALRGDEGSGRPPFTSDFQHDVALVYPLRYGLAVFLHPACRHELGIHPELFFICHVSSHAATDEKGE